MSCIEPTDAGPVRAADRKPLTRKQRAELFERHAGRCYLCSGRIGVGQAWDVEHVRPLSMGGDNDPDNLRPAHRKCHARKSAVETTERTKADRIRAKHLGHWPKSPRPIKGRGFSKRGEL